MDNLSGYLRWRGDLSFVQSPFNEVDGLVFCYLAYVNLDGIAPENPEESITVKEVAEQFFTLRTQAELDADRSLIRNAPYLMKEMAKTRRFAQALIKNYTNKISDIKELQFSAMEILPGDGSSYVAYRGTDDTIVGWKEDFNLSTGTIPAEKEAAGYLNRIAAYSDRPLRVGGHSKGGNLAVFGASECELSVQKRIRRVYNYDGPGFNAEFFERPGIHRIQSKIRRFIPEFSIFGMLLEDTTEPTVIKSSQKGIMQHAGLSWQIEGPVFVRGKGLDAAAQIFSDSMETWLAQSDDEQKNLFIDDLFSVMEAPGFETLSELQAGGLYSIRKMWQRLDKLNPHTREKVDELIRIMMGHWGEFLQMRLPVMPDAKKLQKLSSVMEHKKFSEKRKKNPDFR